MAVSREKFEKLCSEVGGRIRKEEPDRLVCDVDVEGEHYTLVLKDGKVTVELPDAVVNFTISRVG